MFGDHYSVYNPQDQTAELVNNRAEFIVLVGFQPMASSSEHTEMKTRITLMAEWQPMTMSDFSGQVTVDGHYSCLLYYKLTLFPSWVYIPKDNTR